MSFQHSKTQQDHSKQHNQEMADKDSDPSFEDVKPAAVAVPPGQKKKKRKRKSQCPRKEGETEEDCRKRCGSIMNKKSLAKKRAREDASMQKAIAASAELTHGEADDLFVKKVVGLENVTLTPVKERHLQCSRHIISRMSIDEHGVTFRNVMDKDPKPERGKEKLWSIGFHMDKTDDVQGKAMDCDVREIRKKHPVQPWTLIKNSNIPGAGLGCFADAPFAEGAIIGLHMGHARGQPDCAVRFGHGSFTNEEVTCFSFTSSEAFKGKSAVTMGMQMINDPSLGLAEGEQPLFEVNAQIQSDLFVVATKAIEKGEEIFIHCGWEDDPDANDGDNEGDDGGDDGSGKTNSESDKAGPKTNSESDEWTPDKEWDSTQHSTRDESLNNDKMK